MKHKRFLIIGREKESNLFLATEYSFDTLEEATTTEGLLAMDSEYNDIQLETVDLEVLQ